MYQQAVKITVCYSLCSASYPVILHDKCDKQRKLYKLYNEYKSNTPYSKAYKLKQAYETECQHTDQKQRYISSYP